MGSDPIFANCTIKENSSPRHGGGLGCDSSSPTLTNCIIAENWAQLDGGGLECLYSSPTLSNCRIVGNSVGVYGGGVSCDSTSSLTLTNSTITGNSASYAGGGLACLGSSSATVTNCILWANELQEIYAEDGEALALNYTNIHGGWEGEGNIDADPWFWSYGGFDYLLRPRSLCVDAGDPMIEDRISDWHPRWPNWYPNRSRSDIGAYGGPGNWRWLR